MSMMTDAAGGRKVKGEAKTGAVDVRGFWWER